MAIEIEHKYLVVNDEYKSLSSRQIRILQGYLCRTPQRTVRIRIADNEGFLTIKGINKGDSRAEFEYRIPEDDARELLSLCEGKILEKTRWEVMWDGWKWEVDEFDGDLKPLVTAEIELPSSDSQYPLPPFVGENVTGNPKYYNSQL